jgi:hypothetical protein
MAKQAALNHKQSTHTLRKRNDGVKDRRKAAFRALDEFFQESSASGQTAEVRLSPTDTVPFKFGGKQEYITTSDINAYSQHLMTKQIAGSITKKNKSYVFQITENGLAAMKKPGFSSSAAIQRKVQPVPNEVKTRQQPVGIDPGVRPRLKSKIGPEEVSYANGLPTLPLSASMCLPILQALGSPIKFSRLITLIADHFEFNPTLVTLPLPRDTNQTFILRMQTATDYLIRQGFLTRAEKLYAITESGRNLVLQTDARFPDLVEPRVKMKATLAINLPTEARAAFHAINTDIDKVVSGFATADADKLIAIYRNAERILKEPSRGESHLKAQALIAALQIEFAKRSAAAPEHERFKWPTTEARAGDGTAPLQLPKTQAEGMLAHLDYHVGRTHGAHAAIRQRTLKRIFETALPAAFDKSYVDEWGPNGSASRLKKMAESIAAFTRNAKRRDPDSLYDAILHWEEDLKYLHDHYYVGKFSFGWPST